MAKPQFTTLQEGNFIGGIDARSAENQIPDGYAEDIQDGEIIEGRIRKRKGHQGHAGNIPVRVASLAYSATAADNVELTFDPGVDLSSTTVGPVVIYGRTSSAPGGSSPFTTTDSAKYYNTWKTKLRKTFTAGTSTVTVPNTEHGMDSPYLFVDTVISSSPVQNSYTSMVSDTLSINTATYTVSDTVTTYADISSFIYYSKQATVAGTSFSGSSSGSGTTWTVSSVGTQTHSITAAQHGLSNYNIILRVYEVSGGGSTFTRITPDVVSIATNGTVSITNNYNGSSVEYIAVMNCVSATQVVSSIGMAPSASAYVTISGVTTPWVHVDVYSLSAGVKSQIIPDYYSYDSGTGDVTVYFSLGVTTDILVHYDYGTVKSNTMIVTAGATPPSFSDSSPQLTVWGLDHESIYAMDAADRAGWVNHLDAYRRQAEERLVAGLGGNIMSAQTYDEVHTTYLLPRLHPSLQGRVDSDHIIGPVFYDTGETPALTRGYITHNAGGMNGAVVSSVAYNSGTGYTDYTLYVPSSQILDSTGTPTSIGSVIDTASGNCDQLTISGMSWDIHNGTYDIRAVSVVDSDHILISCDNENVDSSDFNDSGCAGTAGIFTDSVTLSSGASRFIIGDTLLSPGVISDSTLLEVLQVNTLTLRVSGVDSPLTLPTGVLITGQRSSCVMTTRVLDSSNTASVTNLVPGDMLSYQGINRLLRIRSINPDSDRSVTIVGDGTTATATLGSGTTSYLHVGQEILLQAGDYSGTHVITEVVSTTEFTFDTDLATTVTGVLVGYSIELDENLTWQDSEAGDRYVTVEERWIPIEAPDDSFTLTDTTTTHHFTAGTYDEQEFLRSVMVADNMYLTNGVDEVMKFDGTSVYRAGIPDWQPGLFLGQDTGATSKIVNNEVEYAVSSPVTTGSGSAATTEVKLSSVGVSTFSVGDYVYFYDGGGGAGAGTGIYEIKAVRDDGSNTYVSIASGSTTITAGTSPTIKKTLVYRYYYTLRSVDANNNIISSAITGYQDHVIRIGADAGVYHRLVGFPVWDNYDYTRLDVEIYRTKANTAAPYYKVTTLELPFNSATGYIDFTDGFQDSDLVDLDELSILKSEAELGIGWSEPPQAAYTTTAGNSLLLANLTDYPELDIRIINNSALAASDLAGKKFTFRRDSAQSGTATDMLATCVYEFVTDTSEFTVSGITGTLSTSFEVTTSAPHGLVDGDWVYLYYNNVTTVNQPLTYAGWWQVNDADISTTKFKVLFTGSESGAATYFPTRMVTATAQENIPVLLGTGLSTNRDGNMGMTNGNSSFIGFQAMRKLAMAINASMRMVDTSLASMATFTPWMMARAGNDLESGQLRVRQPRIDSTTIEVVTPASYPTNLKVFINDSSVAAGGTVEARSRVYQSRVVVSYENYPEIFDNPTAATSTLSDSVLDINPADGQEITGMIPFFGEAAFGAAQQSGVVVIFKTNSIYLIDLAQKRAGNNAVQKLETQGLGCTAPYSIAHTKNGIMFANESGIYCLGRDLSIQYIGRSMERKWLGNVNRNLLSIAQGHHYAVGRQYKLSLPIGDGSTENSEVYVYDHSQEDRGNGITGAWTRFTQHPVTGWANLLQDAYFSSTNGRVFSIRRTGEDSDYRDDNQGIPLVITTRAIHGNSLGTRKVYDGLTTYWRSTATSTNTSIEVAMSLRTTFQPTTTFRMPNPSSEDGFSDIPGKKIPEIKHSLPERRGSFLQVRISNSALDEGVELAGLSVRVSALEAKGMLEAVNTTSSGSR